MSPIVAFRASVRAFVADDRVRQEVNTALRRANAERPHDGVGLASNNARGSIRPRSEATPDEGTQLCHTLSRASPGSKTHILYTCAGLPLSPHERAKRHTNECLEPGGARGGVWRSYVPCDREASSAKRSLCLPPRLRKPPLPPQAEKRRGCPRQWLTSGSS